MKRIFVIVALALFSASLTIPQQMLAQSYVAGNYDSLNPDAGVAWIDESIAGKPPVDTRVNSSVCVDSPTLDESYAIGNDASMGKDGSVIAGTAIEFGVWSGPGCGSDDPENPNWDADHRSFNYDVDNTIRVGLQMDEDGQTVHCYNVPDPGSNGGGFPTCPDTGC